MYEMNNVDRKSPKYFRTNSQICPSPEDELFAAVFQNDTEEIQRLVISYRYLLNHIYSPEYTKPILLIACHNKKVEAKTVRTLLDLGANPKDYDKLDGLEALHLAAQKTDSETLRVLLEKNPNDVNSLTKGTPGGNNALHELIRYGDSDSDEFIKCAKLLISKGININQGDAKYLSPIFWAAKKSQKDLVKLILEHGGPVDIDSHKLRGQSARDIILQNNLYDEDLPGPYEENNLDEKERLFNLLKQRNEEQFVNFKDGNIENLIDADDTNSTLLQMACEKGLTKAVRHLVEKGANPHKLCRSDDSIVRLPIVIAANHGFSEIFEILLNHTEPPTCLLHMLLKNIDSQYHDQKKCYNLLMKRIRKRWESGNRNDVIAMLNEKDSAGNTPLHYAVRYADEEIILDLLDLGASLGSKNKIEYMPVEDIEPEILEHHLDSCVKFDLTKKIEREEFEVTFDYRSLMPPYLKKKSNFLNKFDTESAKLSEEYRNQLVAETEVIYFMSNSKEHRHLLMHPVIVSLLFMKWRKVQWIFFANLIFYITFSLSLVSYIFTDYLYPIDEEKSNGLKVLASFSHGLLLVGFFVLVLREAFQIFVAPINYFKGFENYIEVLLIVLTGIILFHETSSKKQVASFAILFAVFESMLMLGPHPYFSTRVEMLKKVMITFFKFLIWYVWLIVAFALSFYILYAPNIWPTKTENNVNRTDNIENEDEENRKLFESPGKSVFKTIIMLTGEFDAGSLDFETFPITSALIFTQFIFMIAIILLNLLNGLAVSDTQEIKHQSELIGHILRTRYLRHIERMLQGNIIPNNILQTLHNVCCCLPNVRNVNWKVGKHMGNCGYLFPNYLNYELTIYPNKYGLIHLPQNAYNSSGACDRCHAYLDKRTVKRTNNIIRASKEGKPKLEKELEEIKEKLNGVLNLLNKVQ